MALKRAQAKHGTTAFNSKRINQKLALVRVCVPQTTQDLVILRCCELQRTAKKCTKVYNARAQLLFCSLNFLFCDVLVAVVVCCQLMLG